MNSSLPGSSVHGILWASTLEWVAMPSSRGSSQPRNQTSVQFSSIAQLCLTLCNLMDCSTSGRPVHHQLPRFSKLMSTESVMPSSHLFPCCPLLLLPSIFPSIRVFSNESALPIRWPKYWSFSFSISPSKEYPGMIFFRMTGWISLQSRGLSRVFPNT